MQHEHYTHTAPDIPSSTALSIFFFLLHFLLMQLLLLLLVFWSSNDIYHVNFLLIYILCGIFPDLFIDRIFMEEVHIKYV